MVHNHNDQREPSKLRARLHQSRYDTRGIALQTVIIIVVLLAIAGAIAAVLFSRADEATEQLEAAPIGVNPYSATNEAQCNRLSGNWEAIDAENDVTGAHIGRLEAVGISLPEALANEGFCHE